MTDPTDPRPDVAAWSGVQLGARLTGGARNPVFRARRRSEDFVVRRSGRPVAALEWELDLLDALPGAGVLVPQTVRTDDGRRRDGGVWLQRFIPGGPPVDSRDWQRVGSALAAVHEATVGWPQRPWFASARELLRRDRGGDVDFAAMPSAVVELVRSSWLPVLDAQECAVHGDLGAGNVLLSDEGVALIDWDEARVDVPAFDFAHLPESAALPPPWDGERELLITAGVAWEVATCWVVEPAYAARRLEELRTGTG